MREKLAKASPATAETAAAPTAVRTRATTVVEGTSVLSPCNRGHKLTPFGNPNK